MFSCLKRPTIFLKEAGDGAFQNRRKNNHLRIEKGPLYGGTFVWCTFIIQLSTTYAIMYFYSSGLCTIKRSEWSECVHRAVWPDLTKFRKSLQIFGKFLTVLFLLCKLLSLLWKIYDIFGLIFIAANGQILKNDLTIWPHCHLVKMSLRNVLLLLLKRFHFIPVDWDRNKSR